MISITEELYKRVDLEICSVAVTLADSNDVTSRSVEVDDAVSVSLELDHVASCDDGCADVTLLACVEEVPAAT